MSNHKSNTLDTKQEQSPENKINHLNVTDLKSEIFILSFHFYKIINMLLFKFDMIND